MKKAAIITPALLTGGAETMAVRLATNIDKKKYEIRVICLAPKMGTALEKELSDAEVSVVYLGKEKTGSVQTIIRMWKELSDFSPDIVHAHISGTIYATPWIMCHHCRLIHTVHTKPDMEFSEKFRKLLKLLAQFKKVVIVAVSKENQRIAAAYYRLGYDQVRYVNNPVIVSRYYKKAGKTENVVEFINVSRQDPNKNQILAIRAFSELYKEMKHIRLTLVGDGDQHESLIREANKLGLSEVIRFPGEVHNVEDFLAAADVYLSTSHREGLPLSMLEAMAAKLPIISSDVGGVADLIDGNGILFHDDDEGALVQAMRTMAADREMRNRYAERSFDMVKAYDARACASHYEDLYDEFSKK